MRKTQKEQICSFLELLKDVHKEIKTHIELNNVSSVLDLLEQAQGGMITVGNLVEKTEGKDIVSMFEAYCEMVYQIYEKASGLYTGKELVEQDKDYGNNQFANEVYETLSELLEQIQTVVENNIVVKQEVVFLPYKASMWDSLESAWKEENKNPNCDVYVIPIPYFDKKQDGSFGELHYEGNLYPKDVPVIYFGAYDFNERRPDKIYIHNPYDEYNLVTSVHPNFYSKKLKEYTEELIYIPYFVLNDSVTTGDVEHFCKLPGVVYSDKVIVQSEQMKQAYVNVLTKWQGEHTKHIWEKKILGLGSPKFDKVVNTKKEDLEIPKEWQSIIKKSDGSNKKIILYNTSVSSFLANSEYYLNKIESVFKVFEAAKEEVALLWRPHPLMLSTIKSMRPNIEEAYLRIVQKYKDEKWGIYDDTSDLNRAICLADAYFGDRSSVVQLCQKVGMPIMIQNIDVDYK